MKATDTPVGNGLDRSLQRRNGQDRSLQHKHNRPRCSEVEPVSGYARYFLILLPKPADARRAPPCAADSGARKH